GALLLAATVVSLALVFASATPRGGGFGVDDRRGDDSPNRPAYLRRTADGPYGYYPPGHYPYYPRYPYRYSAYPYRYFTPTLATFPGYSSGDSGAGLETLPFPASAGPWGAAPSLSSATASAHADAPATITLTAPGSADVWFDDWKVPRGATKL